MLCVVWRVHGVCVVVVCGVVYCVSLCCVALLLRVLVDVSWSKCCSVHGIALQENNKLKDHLAADIQKHTFSGVWEKCRATFGKPGTPTVPGSRQSRHTN